VNEELRIVKDDAKGVSRVFYFDGEKKTHVGDIAFHTNEFTVCPDLASPERIIPQIAKMFGYSQRSLNVWIDENTIEVDFLLLNVLFL
jgi:hypothetical protein